MIMAYASSVTFQLYQGEVIKQGEASDLHTINNSQVHTAVLCP